MADRITISNFGGINEATVTLNEINIFIGEQATGKSVVAMLVWFCRNVPKWLVEYWEIKQNKTKSPNNHIEDHFAKYFPPSNYPNADWKIQFENGSNLVIIAGSSPEKPIQVTIQPLLIEITSGIVQIVKNSTPQNFQSSLGDFWRMVKTYFRTKDDIFIPAGRSNFYQIKSNSFSLLSGQPQIPPLILEFGRFFEQKVNQHSSDWETTNPNIPIAGDFALPLIRLFESIVNGKYHQDPNQDEFIIHSDNRKVSLLNASSGQQELMPLAHTLLDLIYCFGRQDPGYYCYIEEPETHLFPTGQAKVAKMIATTYNSHKGYHHFLITTHSPYFLSEFNNLIEAGIIAAQGNIDLVELHKIIPPNEILPPGKVSAFLFADGGVSSIMDEETGLILASAIDEISDSISNEFDQLLNLKYAHS